MASALAEIAQGREQIAALGSAQAELAAARERIAEIEAANVAAAQLIGQSVKPEVLAERDAQLASALAEIAQGREQIVALGTTARADLEAARETIASLETTQAARDQALAERESQLASTLADVAQTRERIAALEAASAELIATSVKPEVLAERENQLVSALAEITQARERIAALEAASAELIANSVKPETLAKREAQLAAARAEIEDLRQHAGELEAERAGLARAVANKVEPELLVEREAQLASAWAKAEQFRVKISSLEADLAAIVPQSATDRIALELLAERDVQVKAMQSEAFEARRKIQALEAGHAELAAKRETELAAEAEVLQYTRSQVEQLAGAAAAAETELAGFRAQSSQHQLDAESLRAENARLEAARVESEATVATLLARKVNRAPFNPVRARRVVEMSGLAIHSEFTDAEGDSFADVVAIHLPGTKQIVIHSLPDVGAYRDAAVASSEMDYAAKTTELAAAIRTHLSALAPAGRELAVAFLPGDVLLGAALEQDPGLLEYAAQRGIIVATPNSLVGLLGNAAASWRQHKVSEELREARAANQIMFKQLSVFTGSLEGLRSSMAAVESFNRTAQPDGEEAAESANLETAGHAS